MKLHLFVTAILLSSVAVFAQDAEDEHTEPVDPEPPLTCLVGSEPGGNVTTMTCPSSEDVCQTKFEQGGEEVSIWRSCKSKDACENNAKNNEQECFSDEAVAKGMRVCFTCCDTSDCNDDDELPPIPLE